MMAQPTTRPVAQARLLHGLEPGRVRALRGLDETQRAVLIERATALWQSWCDDWGWQGEPVTIRQASDNAREQAPAKAWMPVFQNPPAQSAQSLRPPRSTEPGKPARPNQPVAQGVPHWALVTPSLSLDPTAALASTLGQPLERSGSGVAESTLPAHDLALHIAQLAAEDLARRWHMACGMPSMPSVTSATAEHSHSNSSDLGHIEALSHPGASPSAATHISLAWQPVDLPATRPWSGAVYIELKAHTRQGHSLAWSIYWSPAALTQLLGPLAATRLATPSSTQQAQPAHSTMQPLESALHNHPLQLSISLDSTLLEIGVLRAMRVGDVLRTSHPLTQAWQVTVLDAATNEPAPAALLTLHAHPGRQGQQRAIALQKPLAPLASPIGSGTTPAEPIDDCTT